jgi:hypothetical protein
VLCAFACTCCRGPHKEQTRPEKREPIDFVSKAIILQEVIDLLDRLAVLGLSLGGHIIERNREFGLLDSSPTSGIGSFALGVAPYREGYHTIISTQR